MLLLDNELPSVYEHSQMCHRRKMLLHIYWHLTNHEWLYLAFNVYTRSVHQVLVRVAFTSP